jgi:hypothetical protein
MSHLCAELLLIACASGTCYGQMGTQSKATPSPQTLQQPQPEPIQKTAPLPPSSSDAPIPDLGSSPVSPDRQSSRVRRILDRLDPNCIDWIFHTCWSSPKKGGVETPEDQKFTTNFEAGDLYFKHRNYRGAVSRFREALDYKPDDGEATFKLAVSLDKLGESEEARDGYEAYLKVLPNGPHAEAARDAVRRIEGSAAVK